MAKAIDYPHKARSFEEELTVYLGVKAKCMQATSSAPLPPSADCPGYVKAAYTVANLHLITVIIVLFFLVVSLQMIGEAVKK